MIGPSAESRKPITAESPIQRVGWSLLLEWWCVPVGASEDDVLDAIGNEFSWSDGSRVPNILLRDRLYGGFRCECAERRHVAFNTGAYTYTNPHLNTPQTVDERLEDWRKLMAENTADENRYIGGGPFCEDAPEANES